MKFHKKTMSNGMKIITVPMPSTETVTLLILVGTGSKYETKKINGISHFLEHLFFKGTKSRPNAGEVHRELDKMGAEHNAFTSKEVTGYWVKTASSNFDTALDIVSDILLEPLFKPEEIEKERGVIIQEISMYEDIPQRRVVEIWDQLLYSNQPAGWDIAGTPEIIKKIKPEEIIKYKESQYVASNAVVVVAGKINPKTVTKKVSETFAPFRKGKPKNKKKTTEKQSRPQVEIFYKKTDQTHMAIGFRGYDMYNPNRYTLDLLSVILGGNTSSRLFMEVREKLGLSYYIRSSSDHYSDTGYLVSVAGIEHGKIKTVVETVMQVFREIKKHGVTEEEIEFAKSYLRGSLFISFESSDEQAMFYAEQSLFHNKIENPGDIIKKIEKVSRGDIMKVVRDIFKPKNINLVAVGPHKDKKSLAKIMSNL